MKQSEIKQELESKSRDELNIIAKKLKIKNQHKLKNEDLILSILQKDNKIVSSMIHRNWWGKYHNHVYGFSSIIGTILAIYFSFFNDNTSIVENLSDSELAVKSTIAIESNLLETYLFDVPYNLKLVLQNESKYNWHDLNFNVFTMYFINDEPCLSQDKGSFIHKITKNIAFLGKGKSSEMNISFLGNYYQFPEMNKIIIDNIKVKDGFLNPFLFAKTFDKKETVVKYSVNPTKFENKLFRLALLNLFKQKNFLPMIFQLMRNEQSKFGGFIDFIQITGESRGSDKDYKFLKLFPIINMWYSNEKTIQYAHNFLLINSACDFQTEYIIEGDTLLPQKSQTTIIHTDPKKDEISRRLEGISKVAFKLEQIELGETKNIKTFSLYGIVLSSPDMRSFKSLKTVKFNTHVNLPWFVPLPGEIKLKPCE